jgi:hypothetical protein
VIITPKDHADLVDLGKRLLDAAGDNPDRVRTSFMGATMSYDVDDDLARAIGRTPDEVRVNEQPIVRDRVGEVGDAPVLPNVVPGSHQAPDVPESVNERQPHGNDELIGQPEDDSPKVASFGEGTGDVEGQTTTGSTAQDGDRAGVADAGSGNADVADPAGSTDESGKAQAESGQAAAESGGESSSEESSSEESSAGDQQETTAAKKSRKK